MAGGQKEHWKGATGLGKTRDHLEARGGVSYQKLNVLQSGGAGGVTDRIRDMGDINGHGEAIIRGTYGFLTTGDKKREKRSLDGTC